MLKGAQVLAITGQLSPAAQQEIDREKESGSTFDPSIAAAVATDAKELATAIAPKLPGLSTTRSRR